MQGKKKVKNYNDKFWFDVTMEEFNAVVWKLEWSPKLNTTNKTFRPLYIESKVNKRYKNHFPRQWLSTYILLLTEEQYKIYCPVASFDHPTQSVT